MAIKVEKLERVYKGKKGVAVHALKGVSFNLPDTGLVFVLGKSGCGKSTLLNALGSLDGFDGGDIIVDGKSLKGFKSKDLDRYRNDYVGFVFQENNLLEKDTVRQNVALPLDLKKDKDGGSVESAVESVGLTEYIDRPCNCLSGGQKQRVAIARAIVKNPKLLLCDEPTGALDSGTGADVFNILKDLSRQILVVVVSHDRESAEKYGDRIIELHDGELVSDSAPCEEVAPVEREEAKRGGLRFVRAFNIGLKYVITRPIRMAISILLCLITFVFVGVADSVSAYDGNNALLKTMEKQNYKCMAFGKAYRHGEDRALLHAIDMNEAEKEELSKLINAERTDVLYAVSRYGSQVKEVVEPKGEKVDVDVSGYVETDASFYSDYGYGLVAGRHPENYTEAVIPLYIFNFFKHYGYGNRSSLGSYANLAEINSYEDIIGKTISLTNDSLYGNLTVTGIVDTGFNFKKYEKVLFGESSAHDESTTVNLMMMYDCIHNSLYVLNGFHEHYGAPSDTENDVVRVIAPFKGSKAQKLDNIRIYKKEYGGKPAGEVEGLCYHVRNAAAYEISDAESTIYTISEFAIYITMGFVAVSALFIAYYASGTISEKRREIGILRAMGASRADILKIIACEHGVFTAAVVLLSSILSPIAILIMNRRFTRFLDVSSVLISFGIRQFAVLLAVAVLAVALGVAFPLIKLLRAKPVDIIADRK